MLYRKSTNIIHIYLISERKLILVKIKYSYTRRSVTLNHCILQDHLLILKEKTFPGSGLEPIFVDLHAIPLQHPPKCRPDKGVILTGISRWA